MSDSFLSRELRVEARKALDGISFAVDAACEIIEKFFPTVEAPAPVVRSQADDARALYRRLQGR